MSDVCPRCGAPYRRHFSGFHCGTELDEQTGQLVPSELCNGTVKAKKEPEYRAILQDVLGVKGIDKALKERIQNVLK
jgi:hypothetical protein